MKDIKHKVKAIIFDMDGTIIKTEHIWQQVTLEYLATKGHHQLSDNDHRVLGSFSGIGMKTAATTIKDHFRIDDALDIIMAEKIAMANKKFETAVEFIEGFEAFHKQLQDNDIPTSIATNSNLDNLNRLSRTMDFTKFFGENMYCVEHVNNIAKPNPDLFLHAADKLGVKPEECVVFEDSIFGFKAAQAAGMKCIAVKGPANGEHLDEAHHAIESYHEAHEALKKI